MVKRGRLRQIWRRLSFNSTLLHKSDKLSKKVRELHRPTQTHNSSPKQTHKAPKRAAITREIRKEVEKTRIRKQIVSSKQTTKKNKMRLAMSTMTLDRLAPAKATEETTIGITEAVAKSSVGDEVEAEDVAAAVATKVPLQMAMAAMKKMQQQVEVVCSSRITSRRVSRAIQLPTIMNLPSKPRHRCPPTTPNQGRTEAAHRAALPPPLTSKKLQQGPKPR